jgi:pyruvate formate lyase activating enzyme
MDPDRHRAETGADNHVILDNLRAVSEGEVEVWVRIPLVPGFNDDDANIERTGAFLEELPRRHRVCVLPYHGIAAAKRMRLGDAEDRSGLQSPDDESLGAVAEKLAKYHLEVAVGVAP